MPPSNAAVEVRTDNRITTTGDHVATPAEAYGLHDWPGELPTPDEPLTVAVMDSGIHEDAVSDHPWFDGVEVAKRYDATGSGTGGDDVGHGTACASVIATATPAVELVDVRIFGESGRTGFDTIADAYRWLIDHADEIDVVNMSWGARSDVPAINQLHEKLVAAGAHDVVAAGNTGGEGGSPSTSRKAFSAGAVDEDGDLTRFTSRDPNQDNPDVAALGKDCKLARAPGTSMGTPLNDQFVKASGTSFAAPYTAAAYVNALYTRQGSWDAAFERAAVDIPGSQADGDGLLKLAAALDGGDGGANPTADGHSWTFAGMNTMYINDNWVEDGDVEVEKTGEGKDHVDLRVREGE